MLRIESLTKSFKTKAGRHYLFKDATLDFPENVNIGILGANGAGKSTLLRILGGIDYPDSGRVICDKSISWPLGIKGGFVSDLTGRENCRMVLSFYNVHYSEMAKKIGYVRELSGLGKYFDEPVRHYSSGMGARLAFSLSMSFDFDYFLIDEITAVGDRKFRQSAKQVLHEKRKNSKVIMVSHQLATIKDFCDVAVVIQNGCIKSYDSIEEAVKVYTPGPDMRDDEDEDSLQRKSIKELLSDDEVSNAILPYTASIKEHYSQLQHSLRSENAPTRKARQFFSHVGRLFEDLGSNRLALRYLTKSVESSEIDAIHGAKLINLHLQQQDLQKAKTIMQAVIASGGDSPHFSYQCSRIHHAEQNLPGTEETLRKALEGRPQEPDWWIDLGKVCLALEKFEEAIACAEEALNLSPSVEAYNLLAQALFEAGRLEESLTARAMSTNHSGKGPIIPLRNINRRLKSLSSMLDR